MAAQCPLGFKGPLPPGHPSYGNMSAASSSNTSGLARLLAPLGISLDDGGWKTWAILAADAAFLLVCLLAALYPDRLVFTHPRKEVRTIKGALPLLGNSFWIMRFVAGRDALHQGLHEEQDKLPRGEIPFTVTVPAVGGRIISINHPLYIMWCQKTNFENYEKGPDFRNAMGDALGHHGIFVADGAVWQRQRKMAANIFSVSNFRTHVQTVVQRDLTSLEGLLRNLAKSQQRVEFQDIFFRYTLSSFSLMAFSAQLNCLTPDPESLKTKVDFAAAFDHAQLVMDNRFIWPLGRWMEFATRQGRDMRDCIRRLNTFCYRIIDLRLEARRTGQAMGAADSKKGKDLLELFMDMGLQREELLPVVLNFLIAGRDTTAQSLAWQFFEFSRHPDVVAKVREEVDRVLGSGANHRLMEYDDMKSMPYTHAAFYEAIRLHPAVPKNLKRAVKDDVIRPYAQTGADQFVKELPMADGARLPDIPVRAGESVIWSDFAMARMPELWGDDCCEYKPERFLEKNSEGVLSVKQQSPYFFHAFNAGPRLCLGQTLATYEGMAAIAMVLSKFDVVYDHEALRSNPPKSANSLTNPIGNPYKVSFKVARE